MTELGLRLRQRMVWTGVLLLGLLGGIGGSKGCEIGCAQAKALHITEAQFHQENGIGYPRSPRTVPLAHIDSESQKVTLPHTLPRRIHSKQSSATPAEALTTVTEYRMKVQTHSGDGTPRYLYIPRKKMDGWVSVYANQKLVYQSDSNIQWNGSNIPMWIALHKNQPAELLSEILIRVQHPRLSGGGLSSVWVGTHEEINWRYRFRTLIQADIPFAFSAAFLAIGFFSLFIGLKLNEKGFLLFFLFSLAAFVRTLHYHIGTTRLPLSDPWFTWMTISSLFWILLILHAFLNYLHQRALRWLDRVIFIVVVVVTVITSPANSVGFEAYDASPIIYLVLLLVGLVASVFGLQQSTIAASKDGQLLAGWGAVSMMLGVFDLMLQNHIISIEWFFLAPLSNIGAFLILMGIIFRRYMAKHEEVNTLNASLQLRLQEREAALKKTHRRLREIELQRQLSQERQRIMQDMHDGMGSNLRTALLTVEKGNLTAPALADVLKECIDDLKLTIDSMEPMDADLLLLLATFRYRAGTRLESAGIALRWNITDIPKVNGLSPQTSLHILRIFQEAFTNVIKHSGATEITVSTLALEHHVCVIISDNFQSALRTQTAVEV
jgi:signal transduction histidine kinase